MARPGSLPWPVIADMYRAACSPRIFIGGPVAKGRLTITLEGACSIHTAHNGTPTFQVGKYGELNVIVEETPPVWNPKPKETT